jgi:parallel beta-helix repeat protein
MNAGSRLAGLGALLVLVVMLLPGPASGIALPALPMHLTYPGTGACAKTSTGLNACIASATAGSTITIKPGTYFESGTAVNIFGITVTGSCGNPQSVIIDQSVAGDGFDVGAANVTITCLTVRHGGSSYDGVYNGGYNNLHVTKIDAVDEKYGIYQGVAATSGLSITGSTILGIADYAVYSEAVTGATITANTFGNTDSYCVELDAATLSTISNNNVGPCNSDGIYVGGGANDMVAGNKIHTADSDCLDIESAATTVTKNSFNGCDGTALYMDQDNATVTSNTFTGKIEGSTIELSCSDNAVVSGNVANTGNDDDDFIYVCQNSSGTETITNNVEQTGLVDYGVYCYTCDNATLTGNKILGGGEGDAFYVYGNHPVVNSNVGVGGWYDAAFYIDCTASCGASQVEKNTESGSNNDYGFYLYSDGCSTAFPCMTISGNTATDNTEDGFYIDTSNALITGNKASFSGSTSTGCNSGYSGFDVVNSGNTLTSNIASNNACDGFYIDASGNTLQTNTATGNAVFGFQVENSANVLTGNIATGNHGDGFNNDGTNTTFTNNKASGNRQDCTNDNAAPSAEGATILSMAGNVCKDGTNFLVPSLLSGW